MTLESLGYALALVLSWALAGSAFYLFAWVLAHVAGR
jgi:hypothetical protein